MINTDKKKWNEDSNVKAESESSSNKQPSNNNRTKIIELSESMFSGFKDPLILVKFFFFFAGK